MWRAQTLNTPSWWKELEKILEVKDFQELAHRIWAFFELPQQMIELYDMENYYLAPPAPKCLCQKAFFLPPDPKFPCHDIKEEQLKKTVAYVQALQSWVEKSNLPTLGQPCLLAESILELREVMMPYVSFSNDTILSGVTPLEVSLEDQPETTICESVQPASAYPPLKRPLQKKMPLLRGLWRNPVLPKPWVRNQPREQGLQLSSLTGGKCCIPPQPVTATG